MPELIITIDAYFCNGCGSCVAMAPEFFRISAGTEKAEVVGNPGRASRELIEKVIAFCPSQCIKLDVEE